MAFGYDWVTLCLEPLMTRNVGLLDRGIRLVVAVLVLGLYGAVDPPWKYLTLLGLIPLATALSGWCPLYSLLHIDTTRRNPAAKAG
jgi:hypothetical protein